MSRLVAAALAAVLACGPAQRPEARGSPIALVLPAIDGGEVDLFRLRGRLVVIHVFASWSLAAQADLEQLSAVFDRSAVAVVGIGVDLDGGVVLRPWARGSGARYPIGIADDTVRAGRSPLGPIDQVPITILLDRAGGIVRRHVGQLPRGALDRWLAELQ